MILHEINMFLTTLMSEMILGDGGQSGHGNPGAGSGGGRRGLFPNPGGGGGNRGSDTGGKPQPVDLNEQIVVTLLRLQHDMSGVLKRLNSLEELVRAEKMVRLNCFLIFIET